MCMTLLRRISFYACLIILASSIPGFADLADEIADELTIARTEPEKYFDSLKKLQGFYADDAKLDELVLKQLREQLLRAELDKGLRKEFPELSDKAIKKLVGLLAQFGGEELDKGLRKEFPELSDKAIKKLVELKEQAEKQVEKPVQKRAEELKKVPRHWLKLDGEIASLRDKEGVAGVDKAIEFMAERVKQKKLEKLGKLSPRTGMSMAAADHVKDIGPKGRMGHDGSGDPTTDPGFPKGSTPAQRADRFGTGQRVVENIFYGSFIKTGTARQIVMDWIIDDGQTDRGHRTNIFAPEFRCVGAAVGDHKNFGKMAVALFAVGYDNKK